MKKVVYLSSLIVSLVLISSCAHQPPPVPQWRYAREAIHLQIHADANLNLHEGKPHTLMICIYQLSRKSGFNSLTEEIDGRYKYIEKIGKGRDRFKSAEDHKNAIMRTRTGASLAKAGKFEEALTCFDKSIELDPDEEGTRVFRQICQTALDSTR